MTTTQEDKSASRIVIRSFYREGPDEGSVSMDSVNDGGALLTALRRDYGICASHEALPVIVLTEPDGDVRGNHIGTVALADYDQTRTQTINRAIRCLEAVRAGLLEAGHVDSA